MANQTETIVTTLFAWIDSGRLNPGDEIEEAALVQQFGVSRTPVREALMQVEATGLVKRLPRKGAMVFKPTLAEFLAILEVHAKLEGQAAGLAARRISASGLVALEAATAACERHLETLGETEGAAYYQLNIRFHGTVAEASGNPFLVDLIKTNARKLMAYYRARYHYAGVIESSAREHREITRLIVARDSERAEATMRKHVHFDQVTAMDLLAALS
ncbi:MAG: GntR family transcriptional regulator [Rhodobacter sp.]|uniref:GntR family transcriptional regulator n=1 Tax=Pararhodobacter sp. TaxID=2127056 RepID=UPI001DA55881|nr:GntR family transcriptional regulator [Pararhodobacter sp.]MCB1344921.1 GntR family transcriptional regulator [Paracoccaceae bacterium]MCC0073748.1 GntR family transcriptional regulator [Rhodobacter sp.]HPD92396.1 GntR family transcriptional regulator [Pararhodobacter sp.]